MKNQLALNEYFGKVWSNRAPDAYKYTGLGLASRVKPGESVIDVGCGNNLFKGILPDIVGIDPANDKADFKIGLESFVPDRLFDVAFCLGSVNFGSKEDILRDIAHVVKFLKPNGRIYWRCNPGQHDHGNEAFKTIAVYPWSIEDHYEFATQFGFVVKEVCWDTGNRIYAEWIRI